ncbi:MAG: response regulator, partial [Gammaproteobacteria bacterium]|nr:response regulator [Gammaproteobacteria bacterium]
RFQALDPIRQAGAVAILPKPFAEEQLRAALYSTLDLIDPKELELEDFSADELKVLIVDDSRMARRHIRRVLESMGIEQITEAEDGAAAIPVLNEKFFDLVVTDYNMPEMDGDALVQHIRTQSNQSSVPVLMVTSEQNDVRLAAARQAGVSALSDKPFEPGNIRALITQILSDK